MSEPSRRPIASLSKIAEGREADLFAWDDGRVLRLFRTPRSSETIRREIAAMRAARAAGAVVPTVFEAIEVDGRRGIVMERVDGPALLSELERRPWRVGAVGRQLGELHRRLHATTAPPEMLSFKDRIRRQIESSDHVSPALALAVLTRLDPLPDGDRLCHGDFHPANVLMGPAGPTIIDWPNATRGDPLADVARTVIMLEFGELPLGAPIPLQIAARFGRRVLIGAYLRAYAGGRSLATDRLNAWQDVLLINRLTEGIDKERPRLLARIAHRYPGDSLG